MGPRSRVLSFSMFGSPPASPPTTSTTFSGRENKTRNMSIDTITPQASTANLHELAKGSPPPTQVQQQRNRSDSQLGRPLSMMQSYQPPQVDTGGDTIPELQPIFGYLNSHSNKLYHEGYFLKLHDLDARGRPSVDRTWTECFAQLVGTVLSLWDAAALDAAGQEGEVLPTFLNLSDASIKMIEELPMHGSDERTLQNVLSISTAANNRYLLHFNSINSLTQWTAGIRLSMYEHATLQEAYTGSLIAGKGKLLNNIRSILEPSRFPYEDWVRVRFGAGTPWRRCWCVITPPDEKEYQKAVKAAKKKNSYSRKIIVPKGDIKFYEAQKVTKKTKPVATISDAYAAYAIYPQSKPLIDQSTLVKLEGLITIHTPQETTSEAFIFIMPEARAGISGFEMLLRWLFRCYDTLVLYGRPTRLIADTRDQRGLMFAMPTERRYGYLDDIDVSALIHTEGSQAWTERQWRVEMKKCTAHKMDIVGGQSGRISPASSSRARATSRASLPSMGRIAVRFNDGDDSDSSMGDRKPSPAPGPNEIIRNPKRSSVEPANSPLSPPQSPSHNRSVSEAIGVRRSKPPTPTALSHEVSASGSPTKSTPSMQHPGYVSRKAVPTLARVDSEYEGPPTPVAEPSNAPDINTDRPAVTPVASPPAFIHGANAKPTNAPYQAPELRRATSEMDTATLVQMKEANDADARENTPEPEPEPITVARDEVSTGLAHQQQQSRQATDEKVTAGSSEPPVINTLAIDTVADASATTNQLSPLQIKPLSAIRESSIPSTPGSAGSAGIDRDLINGEALDRVLKDEVTENFEPTKYDQMASARPVRKRVPRPEGQRAGRLRVTGDTSMKPSDVDLDLSSGVREALSINFDAPNRTGVLGEDISLQRELSPVDDAFHDAPQSPSDVILPSDVAVAFGSPHEDELPPVLRASPPFADSATRQSLTPEEWVQYRAAVATQSGPPRPAMKNRVSSVPTIVTDQKMVSPRMMSAGWDRPPTRTWSPAGYPMAPHSAPTLIEQADSRRLSAQSRMQAARTGGSPLLAMNQNGQYDRSQSPSAPHNQGLYGALQTREEIQRYNRASFQNPAAQQAMAASQHQHEFAMQAAQAAHMNQSRAHYQNQQAVHAAQMAQYQAFMRQQQAQAGMHGPSQPQQGWVNQQSPGSPYRGASPNGRMPPNASQGSYNSYGRPGYS